MPALISLCRNMSFKLIAKNIQKDIEEVLTNKLNDQLKIFPSFTPISDTIINVGYTD